MRTISIDIEQIDSALDGDGVLAGLLWVLGSPKGFDPAHLWTKVFPGDSTPVWLWIRSPDISMHFAGEWGIARVEKDIELGPNGLFMTLAASISESPVVVHLSKPGWVDFGRGELPPDIPGAPVIDAINHAERSTGSGTFADMFFGNLADRLTRSRPRDVTKEPSQAPKAIASFLSSFIGKANVADGQTWPPLPDVDDEIERRRFARLRRARGLSLTQVSERLATSAGVSVSKDTLRRFETDVGQPHDRLLPVALDHVLGAEGRLSVAKIRSDKGSGVIRFPSYWHGPIWLAFDGPDELHTVQMLWGDWIRELVVAPPMLVVSHSSQHGIQLRLTAPPELSWTAGVGARAGAKTINHGWAPASPSAAQRVISETDAALYTSIERRRTEDPTDEPE